MDKNIKVNLTQLFIMLYNVDCICKSYINKGLTCFIIMHLHGNYPILTM